MSLLEELKRRNVIRVGIAYVVGAWLLVQGADLVLDLVGADEWLLRAVAGLLALGFIPAVIFAWAFEITPEGIKLEKDVSRSESITHQTAKKLDFATMALVIGAVALLAVDRMLPEQGAGPAERVSEQEAIPISVDPGQEFAPESPQKATDSNQKSIAVLPFANRSNQDDDLFFTDGIHDDLLTQLAKVGELTVISRTSVMEYRDTSKNLKQIGAELNVGTILEGGVQKVGDRVRVTAQLIDVATDNHLWAESFDRELTAENIFELQSEIARQIVKAISVELTPEEELRLSEIPTQNLAAYEAYLKAREVFYGANYARGQEEDAQPWLEKAIALDPDYAQAHALLANIYGQTYWRGIDTSPELPDKYRRTLDRALALNPNSPEALRAMAGYHYRVENDYGKALEFFNQALENAPGTVDLHGDKGMALRRLGRWEESISSFRKATEIDPTNRFYESLMIETMSFVFDWQGIMDHTEPLEDADLDTFDLQFNRAQAQFNLSGNLHFQEAMLERMTPVRSSNYVSAMFTLAWYQRNPEKVIAILNNPNWMQVEDSVDFRITRLQFLADAYRLQGDVSRANEYYQAIVDQVDVIMASALQPQAYQGMIVAVSLARLGRFDEALEFAAGLVRDIPSDRDAMLWGNLLVSQAMVIGLAGDPEKAIDQLQSSMEIATAFPITPWVLHYDPNWDFLRDNPRFAELATPVSAVTTKSQ